MFFDGFPTGRNVAREARTIAAALAFCLLGAAGCVGTPAAALQSPAGAKADPRVARLLDLKKIRYEVDGQGDYKILDELPEGRTQLAFVNSNTEKYGPYETREVWAAAFRAEGPFPPETANLLLADSYRKILGAWQTIVGSDGRHVAVFAMKIPADTADADFLAACVENVIHVADDMERRLTGKDDF